MSIIKPSKEDRIKYTFTKLQRNNFMELIKSLGVPTIVWNEMGLMREEYSKEHLIELLLKKILANEKEIEELKKAIGEEK